MKNSKAKYHPNLYIRVIGIMWCALLILSCLSPMTQAAIVWSGYMDPEDPTSWTDGTVATIYGTITVDGGSSLQSNYVYLPVGTVTVTGINSTWNIKNALNIGSDSSGTLNIETGGQVNSSGCSLGNGGGSTGTVTVTGSGSTWNNTGTFFIGRFSNGILDIEAGGQVNSQWGYFYIGSESGSTGKVTVSGSGSKLTLGSQQALYVGYSGNGTLTVTDGGIVNAAVLYASLSDLFGNGTIEAVGAVLDGDLIFTGNDASHQSIPFGTGGTLNLNLAAWNSYLGAGYKGTGTIRIADGVAVTSHYGVLGFNTGSTGMATVTGVGSKWTISTFSVGGHGDGILNIEAGGQVDSGWSLIGANGGSGKVTVTGAGSKLTCSELYVSRIGSGTLTVANGGVVNTNTLYASLDNLLGNGAIMTKGGVLDADLIFDGVHGLQNTVPFGTGGTLGVNLDGGVFTLGVGYKGAGTLKIADGLTVTSSMSYLGYAPGSQGTATVTGNGSKWNCGSLSNGFSGSLSIGYMGGNGTLIIEDGGQVNGSASIGDSGDGASGTRPTGTATVTGNGSLWTCGSLRVGNGGKGTLNVEAGGQVNSTDSDGCTLGWNSGFTGTANVIGNGSIWTTPYLRVGLGGNGILNIGNGGCIKAQGVEMAFSSSATGACNIDSQGTLQVGSITQGSGVVDFKWNDGTIQNFDASTDLLISSNLVLKLASTGIHSFNIDPGRTGTIDAILVDATTGGTLNKNGLGTLILTAANTYTGDTTIEDGILSIRTPYLNDLAGVHISSSAKLDLGFAGSDTVSWLYLDGLQADSGTWGSSLSSATHIDNVHFSGTGMLTVVPEPSTFALLGMSGIGLIAFAWRRCRK